MRAFALPHNPRLACTRQAQLEPGRQAGRRGLWSSASLLLLLFPRERSVSSEKWGLEEGGNQAKAKRWRRRRRVSAAPPFPFQKGEEGRVIHSSSFGMESGSDGAFF